LQEASLCIFEISDSNPNVLFELGLAYMLGKTAILLAHKDSPGTQISDISGIHRIEYGDLVECRALIARAIDKSKSIAKLLSTSGGTAP
jgi:predicted nucleotide-binding protein